MKYFQKLNLPTYPYILDELNKLIEWNEYQQICLNSISGHETDHQFGYGSLIYDWSKQKEVWDEVNNAYHIDVPKRDVPLNENDFTEIVSLFQGTIFEEIITMLKNEGYCLGRVRIMKLNPMACFSWHADNTYRLHYPIKTHLGAKMIIENEICDLKENTWYWTDTKKYHTAINANRDPRLHLVVVLTDFKGK